MPETKVVENPVTVEDQQALEAQAKASTEKTGKKREEKEEKAEKKAEKR